MASVGRRMAWRSARRRPPFYAHLEPPLLSRDRGPWTWRCNGFLGGASASCSAPVRSSGGATTTAGVPLPAGWTLRQSDRFGTDGNVTNYTQLHAEYCEGQFYNVDNTGCLVRLPNVVINNEQATYEHFETSIVFFTDHLEIQGRGQPNGVIQSAEMVAKYTPLNFCIEARYQIPGHPGLMAGFLVLWFDQSEYQLRDRRGAASDARWQSRRLRREPLQSSDPRHDYRSELGLQYAIDDILFVNQFLRGTTLLYCVL